MGQMWSNTKCHCHDALTSDTRMRFCRSFYKKCKVSSLPYETLQNNLRIVNDLVENYINTEGRRLKFVIKEGSDLFFWWRSTVAILMQKIDHEDDIVEGSRSFNLCQFMRVYDTLNGNTKVLEAHRNRPRTEPVSSSYQPSSTFEKDCCICEERPKDVILPCTHAFCSVCIQQWNLEQSNCPLCREAICSLGDNWEVENLPDTLDVEEENQKALDMLLDSIPCNEYHTFDDD